MVFYEFRGQIMIEEKEERSEILEQAADEGGYKPIRPLPLPIRKKKKKKKKLFPTDPEDPETDDDFDEEEDDDDDDDTETDSDTEPDAEDENELKQEEQKPQSFFKNPFFLFKRHENMALKKGPNPEKQQRSPIQKFFDVLLYGVEGARIKNGELPKQNIADELLLGLGFKAYLKDVLLGRQAAKYWKQKISGKENSSLLKTGLKRLKKQAAVDPEIKFMVKGAQKDLDLQSLALKKQADIEIRQQMKNQLSPQQKTVNMQEVESKRVSIEKQVLPDKSPDKPKNLTEQDMRQILLKTEQEEKRILHSEKQSALQQKSVEEKLALMEKRVQENKTLQQAQTHKNLETQAVKNMVEQNDKAQMLMQKDEMQMQRAQQSADSAALQSAARLAMVQMGALVRSGVEKSVDRQGVMDVVQRGMNPIDRQIAALGRMGVENTQPAPVSNIPIPVSAKEVTPPAPVQSGPQERPATGQPTRPSPDDARQAGGAARVIAERGNPVLPEPSGQQNLPEKVETHTH